MSYKFLDNGEMYNSPSLRRIRSADNLKLHNSLVISKENQWRYIDFVDYDFEYYDNNRFLNSEMIKKLKAMLTPYPKKTIFYISKKRMGSRYMHKFVLIIDTYNYDSNLSSSIIEDLYDIWVENFIDEEIPSECLQSDYLQL